jgi:cytochrome c oxidase assembly protein subunit 15
MNDTINKEKNDILISRWLWIGVFMIVIQVVLGGITRLTESGLSITEWKPITGALPPIGNAAWQIEFEKYRGTDQFKYVHQHFSMSEFKFIFFWEWFHRLWARMMGLVFLFGFIYFLAKRMFSKNMIVPMVVLFFLGGIQGAIGWIMVSSGLVPEKYFVGHVELTTHFIAALILLVYTCWFALQLSPFKKKVIDHPATKKWLSYFSVLFLIQLMYGGFMAGLKAAAIAPTWPDINGSFIPKNGWSLSPYFINFINDPLVVHFMHRGIGYILLALTLVFFVKTKNLASYPVFNRFRLTFLLLIGTQILLGILTVLNATNQNALTWLGVLHQFTAILLALCITVLVFITSKKKEEAIPAE